MWRQVLSYLNGIKFNYFQEIYSTKCLPSICFFLQDISDAMFLAITVVKTTIKMNFFLKGTNLLRDFFQSMNEVEQFRARNGTEKKLVWNHFCSFPAVFLKRDLFIFFRLVDLSVMLTNVCALLLFGLCYTVILAWTCTPFFSEKFRNEHILPIPAGYAIFFFKYWTLKMFRNILLEANREPI